MILLIATAEDVCFSFRLFCIPFDLYNLIALFLVFVPLFVVSFRVSRVWVLGAPQNNQNPSCPPSSRPSARRAIFATGGDHESSHAHWGYYMIAAVILQVLSGWLRVKGLGGKNANFSLFHRVRTGRGKRVAETHVAPDWFCGVFCWFSVCVATLYLLWIGSGTFGGCYDYCLSQSRIARSLNGKDFCSSTGNSHESVYPFNRNRISRPPASPLCWFFVYLSLCVFRQNQRKSQ